MSDDTLKRKHLLIALAIDFVIVMAMFLWPKDWQYQLEVGFVFLVGWLVGLRDALIVVHENPFFTWQTVTAAVAIALLTVFCLRLPLIALRYGFPTETTSDRKLRRWMRPFYWTALLLLLTSVAIIGNGVVYHTVQLFVAKSQFLGGEGRRNAVRTHARNNLKYIGIAADAYHDQHKSFPSGATFDETGRPLHSWVTKLLPYGDLSANPDRDSLYRQIHQNLPWDDPRNLQPFQHHLIGLHNPGIHKYQHMYDEPLTFDSQKRGLSHYAANFYVMGPHGALSVKDIKDGTSNTFLIGEVNANFRAWGDPLNFRDVALGINRSRDGFGGPFKGGAFFLRADGSVQFINEDVDLDLLKATATPSGGEAETIHNRW